MRLFRGLVCVFVFVFVFDSCRKEPVFVAPDIELVSYSLKEFPDDSIFIDVEVNMYNNDDREADIQEISYQVFVHGYSSEPEIVSVNEVFQIDEPLNLILPVRVATSDALELIDQLDFGEEIPYQVIGSVKLNHPVLKLFDLPFDVQGSAMVEVGYDAYYEEPQLALSAIAAEYTFISLSEYQFDFVVTAMVHNPNPFAVTVDQIDYQLSFENIQSDLETYPNDDSEFIELPAEGAIVIDFPLRFILNYEEALPFIELLLDGTLDYTLTGEISVSAVNSIPFERIIEFFIEGRL